jgi:uncharacterized protein (TIGR02265 family)
MAVLGLGNAVPLRGRPGGEPLESRASAEPLDARGQAEVLTEIGRFCDVQERLTLIPPSAKLRGYYCRSIEAAVEEGGKLKRYRELFPRDLGTLQWHPAGEILKRLVVGAALLAGPEHVHEGMLEMGRRNALEFARTLLGRMLMRLLSKDPKKLLLQGVAARRQTCSYGSWQITFPEERMAVMTMTEEYMYIESWLMGAAHGTFDAIGLSLDATCELDTKFVGRHVLRW